MTRPKIQQRFGDLKPMKVALSENIRKASVIDLNRALADTIVLRDLYKKHHWQVTGPTFRELHLLFDEHQAQQGELIDEIAERIMQLGGVSIARQAAHRASEQGDDGTNDLFVSDLIRLNEKQAWFVNEHLTRTE